MSYLLYGLAAYCLYLVIRFVLVVIQAWGWIFQPIRFEISDEFPDELVSLFDGPIHELTELGFKVVHYFASHNIIGIKNWAILLQHQATNTFVTVELQSFPDPTNPFSAVFYTFLADGGLLMTVNGAKHSIIGALPNTILQDAYVIGLQNQWEIHSTKLDELLTTVNPQMLSETVFLQQLEMHYRIYVDYLFDTNQISWDKNKEQFSLKPLAILMFALKLLAGNRKLKVMQKQVQARVGQNEITPVNLPLSFEVEAFHTFNNQKRRQATSRMKIGIAFVSLVLFGFSFLLLFELETLLIIIGVLAFHELGHFTAMKLIGYQNLSFFFLPFLGAAVAGQKQDATLVETILVLFAGPLPGLILGVGLIFLAATVGIPSQLPEWVIWLLVLNYLNLLPLYPLDGGRIVDQLLFAHQAYAGTLFKLFATGTFLFGGFWFGDFILFILALILGVGIPGNFRYAKIMGNLKTYLPKSNGVDEDDAIETIFRAMKQAGFIAGPFHTKYQLVNVIRQRQVMPESRLGTRLAFIIFYLAILGGGLLLWFWLTGS